MHGAIGLTVTLRNRKGRKRKQGRRSVVTGHLVREQVNYQAMAGEQPHRVDLPERWRLDHRAGTVLGRLLLTGKLGAHERDDKPSEQALARYEAGERFSGIVRRYRVVIEAPGRARSAWHVTDDDEVKRQQLTEETSRGFDCRGDIVCELHLGRLRWRGDCREALTDSCECVNRMIAYNNAHDALACVGRSILVLVNRVVVHDEPCEDWQLPSLIIGLGTLAREFGLRH